MADNLFATGDASLALPIYEQIDTTGMATADSYWIEYQIASCHRRLRNDSEAEKRYRRLAGLSDGGWYSIQAKWWLDTLSARQALEADLQQITGTVQMLEQEIHAQPAQ